MKYAPSRARKASFRTLLILFSLVWLTFGFGIIDLTSGFLTDGNPRGSQVLSAAYGVIAGVVLPLAFLAQLGAPGRSVASLQQVAVVALAFALAGALALDPLAFISVAMLIAMLAVLLWLHPARPQLAVRWRPRDTIIAALAALAMIPAVVYGLSMAANQRAALPPVDEASRPQAGGWTGAAVLAIVIVLLALLAAARTSGWRVPAWSAAAAAFVFGLVSVLNPEAPGSVGSVWGSLMIAWGLLVVAASELVARRRILPPMTTPREPI